MMLKKYKRRGQKLITPRRAEGKEESTAPHSSSSQGSELRGAKEPGKEKKPGPVPPDEILTEINMLLPEPFHRARLSGWEKMKARQA